jgi:hypothetical protein
MARTIEDRKRTLIELHKLRMTEHTNGIALGTSGTQGRIESSALGSEEGSTSILAKEVRTDEEIWPASLDATCLTRSLARKARSLESEM